LESSARVHAADRAMCQSKYTWHRLVEKSACHRKFFIQLVTSLYLSRDHELSQSFHITPAVTLRAKALRPFGDGYPFGTLYGRRRSSSVVGWYDGTFAFGEDVIGWSQRRGRFRRCRTGKAFDV